MNPTAAPTGPPTNAPAVAPVKTPMPSSFVNVFLSAAQAALLLNAIATATIKGFLIMVALLTVPRHCQGADDQPVTVSKGGKRDRNAPAK